MKIVFKKHLTKDRRDPGTGLQIMARPLRMQYDGALYYVTSRGNERKDIFKDISDRSLFFDILSKVTVKWFKIYI